MFQGPEQNPGQGVTTQVQENVVKHKSVYRSVNTSGILLKNVWLPSQSGNLQTKYMVKRLLWMPWFATCLNIISLQATLCIAEKTSTENREPEHHLTTLKAFLLSKEDSPFQFSTNLILKTDFGFCFIKKDVCSIAITKATIMALLYGFCLGQNSEHLWRRDL